MRRSDGGNWTGITIVMVTHTTQLVAYGTRHVEMASGRLRKSAA
jgi:predicted ABC-type transport system involved in lysophospholipase L1 biosynthesis ATPase subunit